MMPPTTTAKGKASRRRPLTIRIPAPGSERFSTKNNDVITVNLRALNKATLQRGIPDNNQNSRGTNQAKLRPAPFQLETSISSGSAITQQTRSDCSPSGLIESSSWDDLAVLSDSEDDTESQVENGIEQYALSCNNADRESVSQIKLLIEDLNHSIDNIITTILENFTPNNDSLPVRRTIRPPAHHKGCGSMAIFYNLLSKPSCISFSLRASILDLILHDIVCQRIYDAFFQGKTFLGVQVDPAITYTLERIYKTMVGQQGLIAAQHWRSSGIQAMFATDGMTEIVESVTLQIMRDITSTIRSFPVVPDTFVWKKRPADDARKRISPTIKNYQSVIDRIVRKAREVSLGIQKNMIVSSIQLTVAKMPGSRGTFERVRMKCVWGDDVKSRCTDVVLGTFKFGLSMHMVQDEGERKSANDGIPIIAVTVITSAVSKLLAKKINVQATEEI